MAISDEKRREVAQKLRDAATECYNYGVLESDVLNILGVYATDSACLVSSDSVMDVADLIDRPTCRNVGDDYMFKCSECGAEFEPVTVNGNEYGDVFYTPLKPLYCSACGAEVQE